MNQAQDNVSFADHQPEPGDSRQEILRGLGQVQKTIDPKWFYDERGSRLFEAITRQPEYYLTRAEHQILRDHRGEISRACGAGCVLIEPGSGACEKARLLFDELQPRAYVPVDISADFLRDAARELGQDFPWMTVRAVCADFNSSWSFLDQLPDGRRLVFYPGSTIGNLEPAEAIRFLRRIRHAIGEAGGALVGVDPAKPGRVLNAAYNDARGITAEFNLNVLDHVGRILGCAFDKSLFSHRAYYDERSSRVEMHLVSKVRQSVDCGEQWIEFEPGETIHTENSYKYSPEAFSDLALAAGLSLSRSWSDAKGLFAVHYLEGEHRNLWGKTHKNQAAS